MHRQLSSSSESSMSPRSSSHGLPARPAGRFDSGAADAPAGAAPAAVFTTDHGLLRRFRGSSGGLELREQSRVLGGRIVRGLQQSSERRELFRGLGRFFLRRRRRQRRAEARHVIQRALLEGAKKYMKTFRGHFLNQSPPAQIRKGRPQIFHIFFLGESLRYAPGLSSGLRRGKSFNIL